uniref:EXS domain-containing protein n=1 Tax=Macrostomum lignano TaxID=282301 RepID=A0A1I8JRU8_9PLAT
ESFYRAFFPPLAWPIRFSCTLPQAYSHQAPNTTNPCLGGQGRYSSRHGQHSAERLCPWIGPFFDLPRKFQTSLYRVHSLQSLIRRFRRKRVFVRAFLLNVFVCTARLKRAAIRLRPEISCHYGMLSKAMTSHASLKALYLSLIFYRACWLGGVKVVATAHAATRKSNDEIVCGAVPHWPALGPHDSLAEAERPHLVQGLPTFIVALTWCTLLFCLDNLPLDPSVLKVQFANYLILDLRFMIFLNATLLGLTFRRLSRSVLYWILALSCCCILWADMLTGGDTLRYKLMTPIYKSHAAWLRRNCSKKIRLRPVINVGQRIVDHEVLHLADSDAFYPTIVGLTWCLAALASCLFDSQLAVLKSPYYCIGDLASVNFARRISSGLVNWVAHLLSAARASLQSLSPGALCCFCLDNLPLDPSVLKVQFANYLILDLRFMIFLNATLLGLTFRRLSRSSHAAWLRRNCSQENPAPPGDQRRPENCRSRGAAPGGFRRILPRPSWPDVVPGRSGQLPVLDSQLAVLKSPYYCIGDLASVNFARRISSGLVELGRSSSQAPPGLSLQSVRWSNKRRSIRNFAAALQLPLLLLLREIRVSGVG